MKKFLFATAVIALSLNIALAQEIEPTFEKQGDLVKATYYYDNGQIKEVGFFQGEKLHDQWITYDQAGKIKMVAMYNKGIKDGKWYVIQDDSVKELTYESNRLIKVEDVQDKDLSFI